MKIPLRFQITEFDCGTVALQNAFNYLYEREEIPPVLVKAIHRYTLNCYDNDGNIGGNGTSRSGIKRLTKWITDYCAEHKFNVRCERYDGKKLNENMFKSCLINNGCILLRCWLGCEHYVILSKIEDDKAYIFDSYYLEKNYYDNDFDIEMVFDAPYSHNRIVILERLFSEETKDLCLGPIDNRECLLINRLDKIKDI